MRRRLGKITAALVVVSMVSGGCGDEFTFDDFWSLVVTYGPVTDVCAADPDSAACAAVEARREAKKEREAQALLAEAKEESDASKVDQAIAKRPADGTYRAYRIAFAKAEGREPNPEDLSILSDSCPPGGCEDYWDYFTYPRLMKSYLDLIDVYPDPSEQRTRLVAAYCELWSIVDNDPRETFSDPPLERPDLCE